MVSFYLVGCRRNSFYFYSDNEGRACTVAKIFLGEKVYAIAEFSCDLVLSSWMWKKYSLYLQWYFKVELFNVAKGKNVSAMAENFFGLLFTKLDMEEVFIISAVPK